MYFNLASKIIRQKYLELILLLKLDSKFDLLLSIIGKCFAFEI